MAGKIDEDDTDAEESDSDDKYGDAELDRYALYDWIRWNYISIKNTVYSKVHFFPLLINSLKGRTSIKWITEQNNICSSNSEIALVKVSRLFLFYVKETLHWMVILGLLFVTQIDHFLLVCLFGDHLTVPLISINIAHPV